MSVPYRGPNQSQAGEVNRREFVPLPNIGPQELLEQLTSIQQKTRKIVDGISTIHMDALTEGVREVKDIAITLRGWEANTDDFTPTSVALRATSLMVLDRLLHHYHYEDQYEFPVEVALDAFAQFVGMCEDRADDPRFNQVALIGRMAGMELDYRYHFQTFAYYSHYVNLYKREKAEEEQAKQQEPSEDIRDLSAMFGLASVKQDDVKGKGRATQSDTEAEAEARPELIEISKHVQDIFDGALAAIQCEADLFGDDLEMTVASFVLKAASELFYLEHISREMTVPPRIGHVLNHIFAFVSKLTGVWKNVTLYSEPNPAGVEDGDEFMAGFNNGDEVMDMGMSAPDSGLYAPPQMSDERRRAQEKEMEYVRQNPGMRMEV